MAFDAFRKAFKMYEAMDDSTILAKSREKFPMYEMVDDETFMKRIAELAPQLQAGPQETSPIQPPEPESPARTQARTETPAPESFFSKARGWLQQQSQGTGGLAPAPDFGKENYEKLLFDEKFGRLPGRGEQSRRRWSQHAPDYVIPSYAEPVEPGNISIKNRPQMKNADGTVSTVRSVAFDIGNGLTVLLPTITEDGRSINSGEALVQFRKDGKHLGVFRNREEADIYAKDLHRQQSGEGPNVLEAAGQVAAAAGAGLETSIANTAHQLSNATSFWKPLSETIEGVSKGATQVADELNKRSYQGNNALLNIAGGTARAAGQFAGDYPKFHYAGKVPGGFPALGLAEGLSTAMDGSREIKNVRAEVSKAIAQIRASNIPEDQKKQAILDIDARGAEIIQELKKDYSPTKLALRGLIENTLMDLGMGAAAALPGKGRMGTAGRMGASGFIFAVPRIIEEMGRPEDQRNWRQALIDSTSSFLVGAAMGPRGERMSFKEGMIARYGKIMPKTKLGEKEIEDLRSFGKEIKSANPEFAKQLQEMPWNLRVTVMRRLYADALNRMANTLPAAEPPTIQAPDLPRGRDLTPEEIELQQLEEYVAANREKFGNKDLPLWEAKLAELRAKVAEQRANMPSSVPPQAPQEPPAGPPEAGKQAPGTAPGRAAVAHTEPSTALPTPPESRRPAGPETRHGSPLAMGAERPLSETMYDPELAAMAENPLFDASGNPVPRQKQDLQKRSPRRALRDMNNWLMENLPPEDVARARAEDEATMAARDQKAADLKERRRQRKIKADEAQRLAEQAMAEEMAAGRENEVQGVLDDLQRALEAIGLGDPTGEAQADLARRMEAARTKAEAERKRAESDQTNQIVRQFRGGEPERPQQESPAREPVPERKVSEEPSQESFDEYSRKRAALTEQRMALAREEKAIWEHYGKDSPEAKEVLDRIKRFERENLRYEPGRAIPDRVAYDRAYPKKGGAEEGGGESADLAPEGETILGQKEARTQLTQSAINERQMTRMSEEMIKKHSHDVLDENGVKTGWRWLTYRDPTNGGRGIIEMIAEDGTRRTFPETESRDWMSTVKTAREHAVANRAEATKETGAHFLKKMAKPSAPSLKAARTEVKKALGKNADLVDDGNGNYRIQSKNGKVSIPVRFAPLETGMFAYWSPNKKEITVDSRKADLGDSTHEITHAMRDLGIITNREWDKLVRVANSQIGNIYAGGREKLWNDYREYMKKYAEEHPEFDGKITLSEDDLNHEVVAKVMEHWRRFGNEPMDVRTTAQKIRDFMRDLGNGLGLTEKSGMGVAKDVFEGKPLGREKAPGTTIENEIIKFFRSAGEKEGIADPESPELRYSVRSWKETDQSQLVEDMVAQGFDRKQTIKWVRDISNVASFVAANKDHLDYIANRMYSSLKDNADPYYRKSLDFSTFCRKANVLVSTVGAIQKKLGRPLTAREWIEVGNQLKSKGDISSCAICYVFSRKMQIGKTLNEIMRMYPGIDKNVVLDFRRHGELKKFATSEAAAKELYAIYRKSRAIKEKKGEVSKALGPRFESWRDVQRMIPNAGVYMQTRGAGIGKAFEPRTDYRREIMSISDAEVELLNKLSGMRTQSWSDFVPLHVIDKMQATIDAAARKPMMHAYTKVPEYVRVACPTGEFVNGSLIPKGTGLDANGKLVFDDVEGMDSKTAFGLRGEYQTFGTILVGANDAHIRAAMADPRIDYIIPYHSSGLAKRLWKISGLEGWKDYSKDKDASQEEIVFDREKFDRYMEKKKKEGFNSKQKSVRPWEFWKPGMTPEQATKAYLKLCEESGMRPKFEKFKDEPGYWKLLVDRRMVDENGKYIEQKPVVPTFDMKFINSYLGKAAEGKIDTGADSRPNMDVVKEFTGKGAGFRANIRDEAGAAEPPAAESDGRMSPEVSEHAKRIGMDYIGPWDMHGRKMLTFNVRDAKGTTIVVPEEGLTPKMLDDARRRKVVEFQSKDKRFNIRLESDIDPENLPLKNRVSEKAASGGMSVEEFAKKMPKSIHPGLGDKPRTLKRIDYRGVRIRSRKDIADLWRVFNDPNAEHLHVIYLKGQKVVAHNAMTSAAGGYVWPQENNFYRIKKNSEKLGATKVYALHNHPSGSMEPSREDVAFTAVHFRDIPGFAGMFVMGKNGYTFISARKGADLSVTNKWSKLVMAMQTVSSRYGSSEKMGTLESIADNMEMKSGSITRTDIAVRKIPTRPGRIAVAFLNPGTSQIREIEYIRADAKIQETIKQRARHYGDASVIVVGNHKEIFGLRGKDGTVEMPKGVLDVISVNPIGFTSMRLQEKVTNEGKAPWDTERRARYRFNIRDEKTAYDDALSAHDYPPPNWKGKQTEQGNRVRRMAYGIKGLDDGMLREAASDMARIVKSGSPVYIPVPSADGSRTANKALAERISEITGGAVVDVLRRPPSFSQREARIAGARTHRPGEMGFTVSGKIPDGDIYFVDNVVTSGATLRASRDAVGRGRGLVYAKSYNKEVKFNIRREARVTPEQAAAYMKAAESGDLETAQRMVDEAAKKAGYNIGPVYHGTPRFEEFKKTWSFSKRMLGATTGSGSAKKAFFFAGSKGTAVEYAGMDAITPPFRAWGDPPSNFNELLGDLRYSVIKGNAPKIIWDWYGKLIDAVLSAKTPRERYDILKKFGDPEKNYGLVEDLYSYYSEIQDRDEIAALYFYEETGYRSEKNKIKYKRFLETHQDEIDERVLRYAEEDAEKWGRFLGFAANLPEFEDAKKMLTPDDSINIDNMKILPVNIKLQNPLVHDFNSGFRDEKFVSLLGKAEDGGHDGAIFKNVADGGGVDDIYAVFSPESIKSADPVTRDDSGRIIPLSDRFNPKTEDIRFNIREQTKSPEFKKWFGKSKVVDESGSPQVVYHGTWGFDSGDPKRAFSVFNTDFGELGSHFGTVDQANAKAGESAGGKSYADRPKIYPVFLSIKNPLRLTDLGVFEGRYFLEHLKDKKILTAEEVRSLSGKGTDRVDNFVKTRLMSMGYDGVVYMNRREGIPQGMFTEDNFQALNRMSDEQFSKKVRAAYGVAPKDSWIAFSPGQIKSAIGNRGTFDAKNPDIRFSVRVTPEQDAAYMKAAESGDVDTARKLLDAAAKEAGYVRKVYHGTDAKFTVFGHAKERRFGKAVYTATDKERASDYGKNIMELYAHKDTFQYGPDADAIIYHPNKKLFKSADPITRDDSGRIIPLSERFNPKMDDIRFNIREQTKSPEFKKWFNGSKAIDESGRPLVLYHGTSGSGFTKFDLRAGNLFAGKTDAAKQAFFFSRAQDEANTFASMGHGSSKFSGRGVYPVFLSMKNPMVVDHTILSYHDMMNEGHDIRRDLILKAKRNGNDGLIMKNTFDARNTRTDIYAVFKPFQIKSAIGNRGTFDAKNPDIRFNVRREITPELKKAQDLYNESKAKNVQEFFSWMYNQKKPLAEIHATIKNYLSIPELPTGAEEVRRSKFAARMAARFKDVEYAMKDVPEYARLDMETSRSAAWKLAKSNVNKGYRISVGLDQAPAGMTDFHVALATAYRLEKAGDWGRYADVMSSLSRRATRKGQEIASLRGAVNDHDAYSFVKQVIADRARSLKRNVFRKSETQVNDMIEGRLKTAKQSLKDGTMTKEEARRIIDSITCK